ncbi:MAG: hypothetical protein ACE5J5_01395 [Candidatus Hydrothermarchaeales archaeon]
MTPELRIRKVFQPASYLIATVLDRLGVVPNAVAIFSFILAIISFSIFLVAYNISPFLAENLVKFALLCIFLNALLDDVARDIEERSGRRSEFGGVLGSFLDRYSDTFIVIGIGVFLKDVPWYDLGVLINIGPDGHMFLVFLIILGSLIVSYIRADTPAHDLGLEARAERMYLLSVFASAGIIFGMFQGLLFLGLVALCFSLYVTVLHTVLIPEGRREEAAEFRPEPYLETSHKFLNFIKVVLYTIGGVLSLIWRGIGVVILGVYQALSWSTTKLKNLKIPSPGIRANIKRGKSSPAPKSRRFERNSFTVLVMDDKTEGPITDARVSLVSEETSKINTNYTDNSGIVMFRNVSEGSYEIEVECNGYEKESRSKYIESHSGGEAFSISPAVEVFEDAIKNEVKTEEKIEQKKEEYEEPKSEVKEQIEKIPKVKASKPKAEEIKEKEDKDESKVLGESMLVEYNSSEKREAALEQIVDFYLSEKRQVILVLSPSSIKPYINKFKAKMASGEIDLINLLTKGSTTQRSKGLKEIPVTNLEPFSKEFEGLSRGSVVVFGPLSNLIKDIGTGAANKFVSQTIDELSSDGISFIAFLNEEDHKREELNRLENLFINLARIEDGKLKKIGGL